MSDHQQLQRTINSQHAALTRSERGLQQSRKLIFSAMTEMKAGRGAEALNQLETYVKEVMAGG